MNEQLMNNEANATTNEVSAENSQTEAGLVLANGEILPVVGTIDFKADVEQTVIHKVVDLTANLIGAYTNVSKGYFNMVSQVAILEGNGYFKKVKGVKSSSEFLQKFVGCSQSTSSELVKVAKTYYTTTGKMKDSEFGVFSYSELVKLAKHPEEVRNLVKDRVKELESHTRKDVLSITDKVIAELTDTEVTEEEKSENTDNSTSTADSAESKDNSADVVDNSTSKQSVVNYQNLYSEIYSKLVAIDTKQLSKAEIVKTIEDIIFEMTTNLN